MGCRGAQQGLGEHSGTLWGDEGSVRDRGTQIGCEGVNGAARYQGDRRYVQQQVDCFTKPKIVSPTLTPDLAVLWGLLNPQTPEMGRNKLTGWPLDSFVSLSPSRPVPHAPGWNLATSSLPQFPLPSGRPIPGRFVPRAAGEAGAVPVPPARAAGKAGSERREEKRLSRTGWHPRAEAER